MYYGSTQLLDQGAHTDNAVITVGKWVYIAYKFDFDGKYTSIGFYTNTSLIHNHLAEGIYLQDKDSYQSAWLLCATDSS